MPEFLLELYSHGPDAAMSGAARRARLGAEALTGEGTPVRCLRPIFVAANETCFLLYEAASADAVRTAAGRAGPPFERLAEVVAESNTEETGPCPASQP